MEIRLISHASVIITSDVSIWTDPWLFGKAFNDSWSLFPLPVFDESLYDTIDFIFISHEHPDHFHIPTLRSLPKSFKKRVTILYQQNNSDKMFKALERLGFPNAIALPHRKVVDLSAETKVYCYQAGTMDSVLGVLSNGEIILNINDCEINRNDCGRISKDIGTPDVVLNQFSIAGYSGYKDYENHLPQQALNVLKKMLANHEDLAAPVTIPFASFIYFSSEDNRYINEFANTPQAAFDYFAEHGQKMSVLYPGDIFKVNVERSSNKALSRFGQLFNRSEVLEYDTSPQVPIEDISAAFNTLVTHLHEKYPKLLLRMFLKPVVVNILDLNRMVRFSIARGEFDEIDNVETDLIIKSQPLHFAFLHPFGIQTLGVSARYTLVKNFPNWRNHRILFSMNNAELYLSPRFLFTAKNLAFFKQRLPGALNQLKYRLKVMR